MIDRPGRRMMTVIAAHSAVDVYSAYLPPILLILSNRASLTDAQAAWLLGTGSLASGLSQPISAWISDHLDSRAFATIGLVIGAVCLSLLGLATSFVTLFGLYALGTLGVGIFHPVAAATTGQLAERSLRGNRALGLSLFFVAGMIGGISGSLIAPWLTAQNHGFIWLGLTMIPGLVLAALLHRAIQKTPHRHVHDPDHAIAEADPVPIEHGIRWIMVGALWLGNAVRFTVNMALVYLVVRYAEAITAAAHPEMTKRVEVVEAAAPLGGRLLAMLLVGMAIGGLSSGALIKRGRERLPLLLTPLLCAPAVALLPRYGVAWAQVIAVVAGIGFASMVPVSLGVAQRLLPHRTSLASSLMLGGAWFVAAIGPRLAEWCLASDRFTMEQTFTMTAIVLAVSGMTALALRPRVLRM
ncbi:MAG: MFS transporter [Phycisphaerales bacterium]